MPNLVNFVWKYLLITFGTVHSGFYQQFQHADDDDGFFIYIIFKIYNK